MPSLFQALVIGALQGVTELFPISSSGHLVAFPLLVGWNINQEDPGWLLFVVATHVATAAVLFLLFYRDWWRIIRGIIRSLKEGKLQKDDLDARLGWLLIVATIPAGIVGLILKHYLETLLASPTLVPLFLFVNGLFLLTVERLRKKHPAETLEKSNERLAHLSWGNALRIGFMQCIALIPGISRSGSTMSGGMLVGLSPEDAVRFSFLMATPIIAAAALFEAADARWQQADAAPLILGTITAGVVSYFTARFLLKYFRTRTLTPFALYCIAAGIGLALLFWTR